MIEETVHHRFGRVTVAIPLTVRLKILSHDFSFHHEVAMGSVYKCSKCNYLLYVKRMGYNDEIQIMFYRPNGLERDISHIKLMYCNDAKMKDLLL